MAGSLQISHGKYFIVLNVKDESGRRKQKWIGTGLPVKGNKRRAESMLAKTIHEYESQGLSYSTDILFGDYMLMWLETVKSAVEINTYESYSDIIKRYIIPYFSEKKLTLQVLQPAHIQEYYNQQMKNGLNPNTVLKQHANIRKALQHAVKMNLIAYNVADRVTLPKKQKYHANFYDEEQINILLQRSKDEPMYPAILLTAFYGLRRSEVLGLKYSAIDFKNDTLTIKDTVVEYKTVIDKERTKTKSSYRTLPLTSDIKRFLQKLRVRQLENKLLLGTDYIENDYVCKRDNGEPFRPNYLTERFGKLIKRYGLPPCRFHDLRHSAATMLLSNGFSLKEIQEYLGHGDIATTANIYAHVLYKSKEKMANSIQSKIAVG